MEYSIHGDALKSTGEFIIRTEVTIHLKPQGSQGQKYEGRDDTTMSDLEIATSEDVATASENKDLEGGKKYVCDEAAMEDVARTIIEEVLVRAAEKVEAHIPSPKGHE